MLRQIRAELQAAIRNEPSALVRWSVYFYLLHLLLQPKIALSELMAFGSIFTLGWALARREVRFSFHILYYPLLVYGVVSTIAAIAAETRVHAAFEGMLWYKMLIFPAAIVLYRRFPRLHDLALYPFALLAAGSSIWGLIQFTFLDQRDLEHRISGPVSHVMTFSGTLLPLAIMFLLLWWHQRKPLFLAITILSTLTLLLTFTRSVWLGWAIAVLVLLMSTRTQARYYALPALLMFITFLPMPLFSRLVSTFDTRQSSNFDRIRMLEAGVEIIKDHPILGV
ncbi:MAG TPA: O-antigen ligase family protein, partial [Thermoanaerobaculia bacterium]|nr:O-antigen ligase family protein [Thermoanaerobaculia bacterium]